MKWTIFVLLMCVSVSVSAQTKTPRSCYPNTFFLIGDSHLLDGSGLSDGLKHLIKTENVTYTQDGVEKKHDPYRVETDARVGGRVRDFFDWYDDNYVCPDDSIVVSLGMNSARMPKKKVERQVKKLIDGWGLRTCYWIFPPLAGENEVAGYWKMMREAVKPCHVYNSREEIKPPKKAIMGKFHLKIWYARKVWAKKVWEWMKCPWGKCK